VINWAAFIAPNYALIMGSHNYLWNYVADSETDLNGLNFNFTASTYHMDLNNGYLFTCHNNVLSQFEITPPVAHNSTISVINTNNTNNTNNTSNTSNTSNISNTNNTYNINDTTNTNDTNNNNSIPTN